MNMRAGGPASDNTHVDPYQESQNPRDARTSLIFKRGELGGQMGQKMRKERDAREVGR